VRVTREPAANAAEHFPGHEIPAGLLVTRPLPTTTTASVGLAAAAAVLDPSEPPNAPVARTTDATIATPMPNPSLISVPPLARRSRP
jgi:hypothetical protein